MAPTPTEAAARLAIGFELDRLWGETMGLTEGDSKETPLRLIVDLLERERVPYALIGGIAVQLHTAEPRSTLDIDLAVPTYDHVPTEALRGAGFEHTGRHEHRDNWRAPGAGSLRQRTAVRFSAEEAAIADAIEHAEVIDIDGGTRLRVATVSDLIELKLRAAEEPKRRASKREHDVADVMALLEEHPALRSPALFARLQDVRTRLLTVGLDTDTAVDKTASIAAPERLSGLARECFGPTGGVELELPPRKAHDPPDLPATPPTPG